MSFKAIEQVLSLQAGWMDVASARVESHLGALLTRYAGACDVLNEAMAYSVLGGGKRLRALLVYATGLALGVPVAQLDAPAVAIELMHAYSLVHDDLPAMDNDALRRGKPTTHVVYGEAMAILVGDALQSMAFQVLLNQTAVSPSAVLAQARHLSQACGPQGMVAGQALDCLHVGKPLLVEELTQMHARKTGDMIAASVRMPLELALTTEQQAQLVMTLPNFELYGQVLGVAYQLVDDVLDVESSTDALGKTAGKDALHNKPTVVSMMGLAHAKEWIVKLHEQALAACQAMAPFDSTGLTELANKIILRQS